MTRALTRLYGWLHRLGRPYRTARRLGQPYPERLVRVLESATDLVSRAIVALETRS